MNFLNNITLRRKRTYLDPNTSNVSDVSTHTVHDESVSSMPDLSCDESQNELIIKLKQQITKLESELTSAHQEIESLSSENARLKLTNNELLEKNNLNNIGTHHSAKKITKTKTPNKNKNKIRKKPQSSTTVDHCDTDIQPSSSNESLHLVSDKPNEEKKSKSKIHILSTNTRNKILTISQKTFSENYKICHFLMPNCGTEQLIYKLDTKIQDFTMNDFCVILIGEEDFKNTHDYFSLIFYIREILQKLNHTNIIICAPTYKYGYHTNMYNWRVENFNNLLYFDILEHKHAYFLDTNKNLKCSYDMFNKQSCTVNKYGMETIFQDIQDYINGIIQYDIQTIDSAKHGDQLIDNNSYESESMFFRN